MTGYRMFSGPQRLPECWGSTWGHGADGTKTVNSARSHDLLADRGGTRERMYWLCWEKTAAVYARVSTAKQAEAGNLERQRLRLLEYAAVNGYRVVLQAGDVASGLNARRRGLRRVVEAARRHAVRFLRVEYPDRLARFGLPYFRDIV